MYQQDIFIEQTVRRQEPKGARILAYITIGITILNVFLSIITLGIFLIPTLLFALLAWWEIQNLRIEFDYNYTNGAIDIARVKGGRQRKILVSVHQEDIVVMAPTHSKPVMQYVGNGMKTFDCLSHDPSVRYYVMVVNNKEKNQEIKVLWEPNDEMLDMLKRMDRYKIHTVEEYPEEL